MQTDLALRSLRALPSYLLTKNVSGKTIARNRFLIPALIFLIAFVLFALYSPIALPNGDTALYLQQILSLNLSQRTTHIGYYLVGIPFIHILPFAFDYSLNLMNCLFGALCVSLLFLISLFITRRRLISLLACLMLATSHVFAHNAVFAEVYVPQLFFFLLALHLLQHKHPVAAGAAYAVSYLITPSASFGLVMLFPLRKDKIRLARFTATFLLLTAFVLLPNLSDYVSGGRGLLKASRAAMPAEDALLKEYREFFGMTVRYLPFLLAGSIVMVKNKMTRDWGIALFSMWFITFAAGERFGDVPVQLPAYAFICLIIASGMGAVLLSSRHKIRVLAPAVALYCIAALIASGGATFRHISTTASNFTAYRNSILTLKQEARPGFIAAGRWTQGILFEHYLYGTSYTDLWLNTECLAGQWGRRMQEESEARLKNALHCGSDIWLLNYDPSLVSRLTEEGYLIEPFLSIHRATRMKPPGMSLHDEQNACLE